MLLTASTGNTASVDVVMRDGQTIPVVFHGKENWRFTGREDGITRISFFATAAPGSAIFSMLPAEVRAVRALSISTGVNPAMVEGKTLTLRAVGALFLVNGRPNFGLKVAASTPVDMSAPDFRGLEAIIPGEINVEHVDTGGRNQPSGP